MGELNVPHKYGLFFEQKMADYLVELAAFQIDPPLGQGKYRHFMNASRMIFPEIKDHEWSRTQIKSLCQTDHAIKVGKVIQRFVYWPGCKSSGKTYNAGRYAFLWWLAEPVESAVILTSTSGLALKRRVWPVIQDFYWTAKRNLAQKFQVDDSRVYCGNLLDSQTMLQRQKGDFLRGIFGLSVEEGELSKTIAKIQGFHLPRILLIVDEATDTPQAIFKTINNIEGGCNDLTVLLIGNPVSRSLNAFDRACQPENGWDSISLQTVEWKAKGDRDLCLKPGLTVRFRGPDSPNVKGGKTIFDFLYTYENYMMDRGKEDTIEYWKWAEGFPPPSGISNTVMDEVMVSKYDLRGKLTFMSKAVPIAGLDPAFGGDRCIAAFGLLGDLEAGKMGVQVTEMVEILPLANSKDEIDFQIAQQFAALCKKREVAPENAGSDATGIGSGVYSHLRSDWGDCIRVEFGGMASDKIASEEDPRPSFEVYDRRVTELWYSCKMMAKAGQLKGLTHEAIREFCFREYEIKARKTRLETKYEFKKKFGKSPDHADAISVLCEVARQRGLSPNVQLQGSGDWDKHVRETDSFYEETSYAAEEADVEDAV